MRNWFTFLVLTVLILMMGCEQRDRNTLKIGTISGPETELMEVAKLVAKERYGLTIKIIEFTDYNEPNAALDDGSIEANMFQHQSFLDQQIKDKNYKLVAIGKTFIYPTGIYSVKFKTLAEIPTRGKIAIPNDPSNEGRALLLLQKAGLIQLKKSAGVDATLADIELNPKKLNFVELDAAQLPRSLQDVDAAVINTNYAIPAGLSPTKNAIFHEKADSPYANVIVVREDELNDPRMNLLVKAFQSDEVRDNAKKLFNDQAIVAW